MQTKPSLIPADASLPSIANIKVDETMFGHFLDWLGRLAVNLVAATLILVVTFWVAGWLAGVARRALGRVHRKNPDPTLESFIASLVRYAVVAVGLVAVLQKVGVQATSIIAVLGAASLAIGLALQGALSNVAAGVMILLFRPYKVGDVIETSTRNGTVKALDLLFTEIATPDNVKVMIPNSKVFGDVILNYSTHRTRRADVVFKVPLKTDLVAVLQKMRERAEGDPRVRKDPAVMVEVVDLSEAFAQAAIRVWTAKEDYGPVRTDLMLAAHLWAEDPTRILPPPRPSKAPDPSPAMPGDAEHHLFRLPRPRKGPRSGPRSPRSPPKA
ncbi:mechanosensitive ion channel protein MscS [Caulobacter sp. Root1455]|uniref:mechanosensitive ion channel family protein n=1 Tax=unclassified Caulobacter TaxID=2648921 RepID=UPI0006F2E0A0|nr:MULTISPECIES: mechanosensitive ion channel family protein [unclassified Caulobacter]KQY35294.1 mechanosensitive ion channel protein MscS [Caulobacter sp. Root487D2Y]KQY93270.1 mechanosensitive ion channel protein MscS [Caulobacter sp. Root1455]